MAYGGDEVSAIVLDPGSEWTRFGFAGEDAPKLVSSTWYGERVVADLEELPDKTGPAGKAERSLFFGDGVLNHLRADVQVKNPLTHGVITDWPVWEKFTRWGFQDNLQAEITESPLIMTDPLWSSDAQRACALRMAFETLEVPAFYLVKSPVCSLFASGKSSGLVVDLGAETASVTALVDGMALYKNHRMSKSAGRFLNQHVKQMLLNKGQDLTPRYKITSKTPTRNETRPIYTVRKFARPVSESFDSYHVSRLCCEVKESCLTVSNTPLHESAADTESKSTLKPLDFELPTGYSFTLSEERTQWAETLFSKHTAPAQDGYCDLGLSDMIVDAINACDVDIRANMANNIIITGGTSLIPGLTERVNQDLLKGLTGFKVRIQAAGNPIERKFSGFIGASIIASLGTFHQLWVSRKEYEEIGPDKFLEKRFK